MLTFIWRFWFRFSHLMIRFSMIFVCDQIEPINKRQTFEQVQVDVINFYNFFCCCCYWSPSNRWQLEMKFQIKQYWPLESSYTIERNEWQWIKIGYWRQVFFLLASSWWLLNLRVMKNESRKKQFWIIIHELDFYS